MATSPEAFRQVKNILQKLDQSIDAARDRRLTAKPRAGASAAPGHVGHTGGLGNANGPASASGPAANGSGHTGNLSLDPHSNRAKPLPPRHDPSRGFIRPGGPAQH